MPEITRTIRFEVVFPGWTRKDKIGEGGLYEKLWTVSSELTQAANKTISALYMVNTGLIQDKTHPKTLAYQALSGKWRPNGVALYTPTIGVGSSVLLGTASVIHVRINAARKPLDGGKKLPGWLLALQGRESLPNFRELPILLSGAGVTVLEGGKVALKIWPGRGNPLKVAPRKLDKSRRTIMRRLVEGIYKTGDAKLGWDRRKKKWFLSIAWTGPVEAAQGDLIAGIHLDPHGRVHLGYVRQDGTEIDRHDRLAIPRTVHRGLRRLEKEREALLNETAKTRGRWFGKGRTKTVRVAHRRLSTVVSRMADSAVCETAASVVATAKQAGASVLVLEDVATLAPIVIKATEEEPKRVRARVRRAFFSKRIATLHDQIRQVAQREGLTIKSVKRIPWKDVTTDAEAARKVAVGGVS